MYICILCRCIKIHQRQQSVASYTITSWTTLRALVLGVWRPSASAELSWMKMFGVPVGSNPSRLPPPPPPAPEK